MTEQTVKSGRANHLGPQRRRPQLLDAALTIAVEDGNAAVPISAVAERVGVPARRPTPASPIASN